MNWDKDLISYSRQLDDKAKRDDSLPIIKSKFRQFIREYQPGGGAESTYYYREKLNSNYNQRNYELVVDHGDLNAFDNKLAESLSERPAYYLPLFEEAAQEVIAMSLVPRPHKLEDMQSIQCQIVNFQRNEIKIRDLKSENIAKMVTIPGIIISSTKASCKATKISLKCTNCGTTIECKSARAFGNVMLPRRCENSNNPNNTTPCPVDPFIILPDKSDFLDVQKLKLQETPEDIPTGEMPRHIWLFTERKLVNKVKPGSRVKIVGIYKIFDGKVGGRKNDRYDVSVRKPYIEVVGIEEENADDKRGSWLPEMEETIRDLARSSQNIYEDIANSIAPAIWGSEDIKKSIACLLFGGSRKHLNGGMNLRGDINVLLLGDPSVAKSQFLKFVNDIAPIAVYTSGKGSSAAGLTASVLKDSSTGEFHLEGGAMVLADGGVVCIDEFDKMRESDRVAIHEAMEQQTISIAKAGITTILNSRTSVLAAANPVFGRYDDQRSTNENIDFEGTILSRFDLIFIIRDIKDRERDKRLARHIMDLHINIASSTNDARARARGGGLNTGNSNDNGNGNSSGSTGTSAPISPEMLSKYISYARHRIHPRLTKAACDTLKNHYVTFRQEAKTRADETGEQSAIPLTVRQLESLIRIAESLAKMELSNEATEDHVKEAVELFKVSTLRAAKQGLFNGEGAFASPEYMQNVQKAERNIQRRLPVGSSMNRSRLIQEMLRRNLQENVVRAALNAMHGRGDVEFRARGKQVYRAK